MCCVFLIDASSINERTNKFLLKSNKISLPLLRDVHSIWQTLIEKLLAKEAPLVTTVKVTGLLEDRPMSTYTENKT